MSDLRSEASTDSKSDKAPQGAKVYDRPKRPGGSTLWIIVIAAILIVLALLFVL